MSSHVPPPNAPPPGVPPQPPSWPGAAPPRESRGVAFFVAIFLGLLLVASAGLNVLLLLLSLSSFGAAGFGDLEGVPFDEVHIAGERGSRQRVLQVPIRGAIAEDQAPLLGAAGGTVSMVRRALRLAGSDDAILGVLLYVDSPGGGVTDSDTIHQLVAAFRAKHPQKPVMALFGDVAASGGYYVAVAAEHILAPRTAITGSIGVIMSAWNFAEAAKKLGVEQIAIKSERTPFKDMLSPTRPLQPEEQRMLTAIVDELYDQFVTVVDEGRPGMDREQVLAAANGGIYTASQALARGLIDGIGDHDDALQWFRDRLGRPLAIVEARRRPGLGELLFGLLAPSRGADGAVAHLLTHSTGPRFLYYWEGGR
jgi:protease-4